MVLCGAGGCAVGFGRGFFLSDLVDFIGGYWFVISCWVVVGFFGGSIGFLVFWCCMVGMCWLVDRWWGCAVGLIWFVVFWQSLVIVGLFFCLRLLCFWVF